MEGQTIKFAGDVSIDKAKIVTPRGLGQDIAAQVIAIQLYEDLFSPFLTGSLIIKESFDLVNLFPFVGEEYLELEISTPALGRLESNIKSKFYIYKLTDRELLGERSVVYQLHFISLEAIVDLNKKASRVYSGKISDVVKSIISDKTDGFESNKKTIIEDTTNNIKYISNFWSPMQNIAYLTEHAVNSNNSPNYLFFENRDGFCFISLESLYANPGIYQEFVYDSYARDVLPDGKSYRNTPQDFKRIISINIPVGYDYMDRIRSGMLASKAISYDVTKKKYVSKNYNVFEQYDKKQHLNPYPINSKRTIFRNNAVIIPQARAYGNFTGFTDASGFKTVQERISLSKLAEANKLNITVLGRTDYTVGQKVSVVLNKFEPLNKNDSDVVDKMFSGFYLISAINHYINRDNHECNIELIKDSSQINLDS